MKVNTNVKAGIDTVPLPERIRRKIKMLGIGTWPTPE